MDGIKACGGGGDGGGDCWISALPDQWMHSRDPTAPDGHC